MKRLFLPAVLFGLLPLCSSADPILTVGSAVVSGPGSTGTVGIQISGLTSPLAAFDLVLQFNPSIIKLDDVRFGTSSTILGSPDNRVFTASGSVLTGDNFGGTEALTAASFVNSGTAVDASEVSLLFDFGSQPSTFTLVFLDFTALVAGSSPLTITSDLLSDPIGGSIAATARNGSFVATPEPASVFVFATCLALFAGRLARKRRW